MFMFAKNVRQGEDDILRMFTGSMNIAWQHFGKVVASERKRDV